MALIMGQRALLEDDHIRLVVQFHQKDLVKQVPGARWHKEHEAWHVPLSWGALWSMRLVFGETLEVDDALKAWAAEHYETVIRPALDLRVLTDLDPTHPLALKLTEIETGPLKLYPFQRVGAAFLATTGSAILADDMGVGKTPQTVRALQLLQATDRSALPALIVAPNSMKLTWQREIEAWWPQLRGRVVAVNGNVNQRRAQLAKIEEGEADVIIMNWESLRGHTRLAGYGSLALKRCEECGGVGDAAVREATCEVHQRELNDITWGTVIADEAHRAKEPTSKQTRALWYVAHQSPTTHRFALTGTPIANHPGELWSLLHYASPQDWPSKSRYVDLFCIVGWNPWGGHDIVDLHPKTRPIFDKIFLPRFLRRPKAAVLPDLPPKAYVTRWVDLSPKQRKAYNSARDTLITELENGYASITSPLTLMTRLIQLSSAYAEMDDEQRWHLSKPSSKVDELLELVDELDGQSAVVFAEHRQLINLAESALTVKGIPYVSIHGGISITDREEAVARFQAGDVKLILITLGAGGEGITLTRADCAVFMQRSWSMVKNRQAEDRIHRIGQDKPVTIIDMIAPDTVEEYRLEVLAEKDGKFESLVQDESTIRRLLGM